MRRWVKWVGAVVVVLGLLVVLSWRRTKVVETFEQPESVEYADGGSYAARLIQVRSLGAGVGLGPDHYEVWLGRTADYGHRVELAATGSDPADITVEWATEGATIVYGAGHEVFVPAEWYLGGR